MKTEWLKKQIKNHQISHLKKTISIQENRNFWKEQQNENWIKKEASNDQLKKQQDQCSTNETESEPFHDTLIEILDGTSTKTFFLKKKKSQRKKLKKKSEKTLPALTIKTMTVKRTNLHNLDFSTCQKRCGLSAK